MLHGGPGGAEIMLNISCFTLQGTGGLSLAEVLQPEVLQPEMQLQPAEMCRAPWESGAHRHQSPGICSELASWLRQLPQPEGSCLAGWCGCSEVAQKWW